MASEQDERLELALAITKAISGDQSLSTKIFLDKFYKRSYGDKSKINEMRLLRFNTLLYKIHTEFSKLTAEDLDVLFKTIFCFLNKILAFGEDRFKYITFAERVRLMTVTYHWVGEIMVQAANSRIGFAQALSFVDWILKGTQPVLPKPDQFAKLTQKSPYFKSVELRFEDEGKANAIGSEQIIVEEKDLFQSLIEKINVQWLIRGMNSHLETYSKKFQYFELFCKKGLVSTSRFKLFHQEFILRGDEDSKLSLEYLNILKEIEQRWKLTFANQKIIQEQISKVIINLREKKKINETGQNLMETEEEIIHQRANIAESPIKQAINNFIYSPNPTFQELTEIIKHQNSIPIQFLSIILQERLTNTKAIVLALLIAQSKKISHSQFLKFCQQIQNLSDTKKIEICFVLHYIMQRDHQIFELVTNIIATIQQKELTANTNFSFLPIHNLDKVKMNKQQKAQIQDLLSNIKQCSHHLYRVKNDLSTAIGENPVFGQTFEKIKSITSKPVDQTIQLLISEKNQEIFELLLMRINQQIKKSQMQEATPQLAEWLPKVYQNYMLRLVKVTKDYLTASNKTAYAQVAIALKMYNLLVPVKEALIIPQIQEYFKKDTMLELNGDDYSSLMVYIQYNDSPQLQAKRVWNIVQQIIKFIQAIDLKSHTKKDLKKLAQKFNYPIVYILQSLHYSMKNNVVNKDLIVRMIKILEEQFDTLEFVEKKAAEIDLEYYQIDTLFDYLLSIAYEETVDFINVLLKPHKLAVKEEKPQKKRKNNAANKKIQKEHETHISRILKNLLSCLQILLNQPNRLKDLRKITDIVEKLIAYVSIDEQAELANCINCWISQFSTLTFSSAEEMHTKIVMIREFYDKVYDFLKLSTKSKEIENQFAIFSVLLTKAKLYQQSELFIALEHQLLCILYMIFSMQSFKQYPTAIKDIDPEKIYSIFDMYSKRNRQINYFFCLECEKNICQSCYTFLHRNHDVNYVVRDQGKCVHEILEKGNRQPIGTNDNHDPSRMKKPERFISRYMQGDEFDDILKFEYQDEINLEKAAFMQRIMREKKDRFFERALERGVDIRIPPYVVGQTGELGMINPLRSELGGYPRSVFHPGMQSFIPVNAPFRLPVLPPAQVMPKSPTEVINPFARKEGKKQTKDTKEIKDIKEIKERENEIESDTQKQIIESTTRQKIYSQKLLFDFETKQSEPFPSSFISMNELMFEMLHSLPDSRTAGNTGLNDGLVHVLEKYDFSFPPTFTTELGQQKYVITRISTSKFGAAQYDLIDGEERNNRRIKINNVFRQLMARNGKCLAIAMGPTLSFMQEHILKKSFKKKEKAKRYNETDNEESFRLGKKMDVPFDIVDMAFSDAVSNHLCVLGANQLNIINITWTSRQFKKLSFKLNKETTGATRFCWLPNERNKILIQLGSEIKLFEFKGEDNFANPSLSLLKKISVKQMIQSFKVRHNRADKSYTCFIITSTGALHSCKFKLQSEQIQYQKLPAAGPPNSFVSFMVSDKSDAGFVSFKDGTNLMLKLKNNKSVVSVDLKFTKDLVITNDGYNILEKLGNLVSNIKQIYTSNQNVVLGCILKKQVNNMQTCGNFAVIEISGKNSIHVMAMNDGFKTQNFEVFEYEEDNNQKFIITGIQSDGIMWMKTYDVKKTPGKRSMMDPVPQQKYDYYGKMMVGFLRHPYGEQRLIDFKEQPKLQAIDATVNTVSKQVEILNKVSNFPTGITMRIEPTTSGKIRFKVLETIHEFKCKKTREVQIPLSVKQSIAAHITKKLVIEILQPEPLSTLIQAHGYPSDKPSPIKDIYKQLIYLWAVNNNYDPKNACHYFSHPLRYDLQNIRLQQITELFKEGNMDLSEQNFILKLELFAQVAEQNLESLNIRLIERFIDRSRRFVWIDRNYTTISVQRMHKKVFDIYKKRAMKEGKKILFGDLYEYNTFKDIIYVSMRIRQLVMKPTNITLDALLDVLIRMKVRRNLNLYLMFGLFPYLISKITNYFAFELQKSVHDSNKRKTGDRLVSVLTIICQYFQYLKNKERPAEIDTFKLLETLLSKVSKNKQLYKQLTMRSFEYIETIPMMKQIHVSYGCKLFEIGMVPEIDQPLLTEIKQSPRQKISEPIVEEEKEEEDEAEMKINEEEEPVKEQIKVASKPQVPASEDPKNWKNWDYWKIILENRGTVDITFKYYDTVFCLVAGLFEHSIVKPDTTNFYIGMLFNLLNLLDLRVYRYENRFKLIQSLMNSVNKKLESKEESALFLVLAHFLQPDYSKLRGDLNSQQSPRLRDLIVEYYDKNPDLLPFKFLYNTRFSSEAEKTIKLKDALSLNDVICDSLIYQLKYLGNLYLCLLAAKVNTERFDPNIKSFILKMHIKKKLRAYKNIVILEKWTDQIQMTKCYVGLEHIGYGQIGIGIKKLVEAIKVKPMVLVKSIDSIPGKFEELENLTEDESISMKLRAQMIKIIAQYYKRV